MSHSPEDGFTVLEIEIPPVQQWCGNCPWTGDRSALMAVGRCVLTAGDPSPSGRCPECDALCYPKA